MLLLMKEGEEGVGLKPWESEKKTSCRVSLLAVGGFGRERGGKLETTTARLREEDDARGSRPEAKSFWYEMLVIWI